MRAWPSARARSLLPPTDGAPTGNSALELYAKVLAQDPQNEEARDGMRRLFAVASARIRADSERGQDEEAGRLLIAFRGVGIDPAAIATLEVRDRGGPAPLPCCAGARGIAKGDAELDATDLAAGRRGRGSRGHRPALQMSLDSQRSAARLGELANHARCLDQVRCPAGSRQRQRPSRPCCPCSSSTAAVR